MPYKSLIKNSSKLPSQENQIKHLKINAFREFMKRLYFESKYIKLTKICVEYLDELLENLNSILINYYPYKKISQAVKNKSIINTKNENHDDISANIDTHQASLEKILSKSHKEDITDNAVEIKIDLIQEKLYEIKTTSLGLCEEYESEINLLKEEIKNLTDEIESYKMNKLDLRRSLSEIDDQNESQKTLYWPLLAKELSKDYKKLISPTNPSNGDTYNTLSEKFDILQKNFFHLQDYLKTFNSAYTSNTSGLIMNNNSTRDNENDLSNHNYQYYNITNEHDSIKKNGKCKSLVNMLTENTNLEIKMDREKIKDVDSKHIYKNTKNIYEKENTMFDLQKQISKLQHQNMNMHKDYSNLLQEKKVFDSRIKVLQKDKDKLEILLNKKESIISHLQRKNAEMEKTIRNIEHVSNKILKDKIDENSCNLIQKIDESQYESDGFKMTLNQKDIMKAMIYPNSDTKKITDLEDIIASLSQELNDRDKEINELKKIMENYNEICYEIQD